MKMMKRFACVLPFLATVLAPLAAHAEDVGWTDWTATAANQVTGKLTFDAVGVNVTYAGQYSLAQVAAAGATNYWAPAAPFTSATVSNDPSRATAGGAATNFDIIQMSALGARTITFSQPVRDPLIAFVSINGNTYDFDQDFEILSNANGFFGQGTAVREVVNGKFRLRATAGEPHLAIQFRGVMDTIKFTSAVSEFWNGLTVGARGLPCKGHLSTAGFAAGTVCGDPGRPVCSTVDGICGGTLANGTAIPANSPAGAPFDGTCNASGAALCASAVCSAADNKCGKANGEDAAAEAECRAGALGADGKCGIPNGTDPKVAGDATSCRSGVLGADGKCGKADGEACVATAECRANVCRADKTCGIPPVVDAGAPDSGPADSGVVDSGVVDSGVVDAGPKDAGAVDASTPTDAGSKDAGGVADSGTTDDAGTAEGTAEGAGCSCNVPSTTGGSGLALLVAAAAVAATVTRRRKG